MKRWTIEPLDTLFFRGGQPFNAGESVYIESVFPPSPETAQGLVRTSILYRHAVELKAYADGRNGAAKGLTGVDLLAEIGNPQNSGVGKLRLQGPFPVKDRTTLFPVPLDVVSNDGRLTFLRPAEPAACDLGKVRLPTAEGQGLKVLEHGWVTADGVQKLLADALIGKDDVFCEQVPEGFLRKNVQDAKKREGKTLSVTEPRVGIARNNRTHTAVEGHLYAIAPLRFNEGVGLALGVGGIDDRLQLSPGTKQVVRFGGEGKLVQLACEDVWRLPECPEAPQKTSGPTQFRMILATPGRFASWLPPGFQTIQVNGETRWSGNVNGLACRIVSACVGKAVRLGGWDLVKNASKDLEACVPAGSVYFCETEAPWEEVQKLHGISVVKGKGSEIGFGLMLIGRWG